MNLYYDDACQFGLAAFETIAVENGTPIWADAHLRRLEKALAFLQIPLPSQVKTAVYQYSRSLPGRQAVKLLISSRNMCFTHRPNPYTKAAYTKGFAAQRATVCRNETSPFVFHKTANYGDSILEKRRARRQGFDEPFFFNTRGQLAEGATTNIFLVKNDRLVTPPVPCGLLPGIVRAYLCRRFPVTEQVVTEQDLPTFTECFVTNSLLGIMGVRTYGSHRFTFPGPYTRRLRAAYEKDKYSPL